MYKVQIRSGPQDCFNDVVGNGATPEGKIRSSNLQDCIAHVVARAQNFPSHEYRVAFEPPPAPPPVPKVHFVVSGGRFGDE